MTNTETEQIEMRSARGNSRDDIEGRNPSFNLSNNEPRIGLAFSGGGIRSAALCSGVLRRLLHRSIQTDYVSCVSGGNFTAASYVDWKYHEGNEDRHEWHKKYFEQMRENAGYVCNWNKSWKGIVESTLLTVLLLFVNIVIPFAIWGSFSIPVAYMVDLLFGDIMRIGFNTNPVHRSGENITSCGSEFNKDHPDINQPIILFTFLIICFVVFYIAKGLVPDSQRFKVSFLDIVCGLLLAFVFLPWLVQQFFEVTPLYLNIIVIVLSIFFWLGFPLLRKKASLALVFYFYAFVIRWRVYKGQIVYLDYTDHSFFVLLLISGCVIWATPFLGMFSNTAIFTFFKWRLQKAYFHEQSSGAGGCQGIGCRDLFPIVSNLCHCTVHKTHEHDLPAAQTMDNIKDVKPQYISNVAVDYWKTSKDKPPYGLISISPNEVERITERQPRQHGHEDRLCPENVKLADAMTISASIMSPSEANNEPFRDLQLLLGLAIRKHMRSDHTKGNTICTKIALVLQQAIVALPLVILAVIYFIGHGTRLAELYTMFLFGTFVILFAVIAILPAKGKYDSIVRWCHVHLYHVRFLREFFKITSIGPAPPALLALSDAGRLEKYGLIPLLKRKLPKILIVDGSFIADDNDYAKYLLKSLKLARKELHCEFVGYGGRDVLEEIEKKYVQPYPGKVENRQRSYRFLVRYFQDSTDSLEKFVEVSRGEILIIAPRHPDKGIKLSNGLDSTWAQFTHDTGEEMCPKKWGPGFVLQADDVDRLTFCCCECCHSSFSLIQKVSHALCSSFPSHSTANQFFTPSQFTAYHREGYRACVEAGVDEFLSASTGSTSVTIEADPLTL